MSGGTWPAKKSNTQSIRDGVREVNERFAIRQTAGTGTPYPAPTRPSQLMLFTSECNTDKHVSWQYRVPAAVPKGDRNAREPGYEGVIARTRDAGKTFETIFADSSRLYFNGIDCPTVTHCWAVAEGPEGGWIFATSDAGVTWTEQFFYATGGFFQVKMLNTREGWAAGGVYKQYVRKKKHKRKRGDGKNEKGRYRKRSGGVTQRTAAGQGPLSPVRYERGPGIEDWGPSPHALPIALPIAHRCLD